MWKKYDTKHYLSARNAAGARTRSMLTDDQVRAILRDPRPQYAIAHAYGIRQASVSNIKRGFSHKYVWMTDGEGRLDEHEVRAIVSKTKSTDVVRLGAHIEAQRYEIAELRQQLAEARYYNGKTLKTEKRLAKYIKAINAVHTRDNDTPSEVEHLTATAFRTVFCSLCRKNGAGAGAAG